MSLSVMLLVFSSWPQEACHSSNCLVFMQHITKAKLKEETSVTRLFLSVRENNNAQELQKWLLSVPPAINGGILKLHL